MIIEIKIKYNPNIMVCFISDINISPPYDIFSELEKAENDLITSYSSFVHRHIRPPLEV